MHTRPNSLSARPTGLPLGFALAVSFGTLQGAFQPKSMNLSCHHWHDWGQC